MSLAPPTGSAVASRLEGFEVEPFDGAEVLDVGRDERGHVHDGGGADERIGQPHAVGERQAVDQLGRSLADGRRDRHDLSEPCRKASLQPRESGLVAAALGQLDVAGLRALTGTPGAIESDTKQAEQCKAVSTTAEQDKKMADFIVRTTANPGMYTLGGNNCTNFVRSVLQQVNISTPGFPGPKPYFDAKPPRK